MKSVERKMIQDNSMVSIQCIEIAPPKFSCSFYVKTNESNCYKKGDKVSSFKERWVGVFRNLSQIQI